MTPKSIIQHNIFGGTLPNIEVVVRPEGMDRMGPVILQGPVFP